MSSHDDSAFDGNQDNRVPRNEDHEFEEALHEVGEILRRQRADRNPTESPEEFLEWSRNQKKHLVASHQPRALRIAAAAAILCIASLSIVIAIKGRKANEIPASPSILTPVPGTLEDLAVAVEKDKVKVALASEANKDPVRIDEAHSALTLREDVLLRGLDAVPDLLDTLGNAQSMMVRADAAGLLALLRYTEAAIDIYDVIVLVIDDRGPELEPLLHAMWRMLFMLESPPSWAHALGKEISSLVRDPGPIRRKFGLRILSVIEEKTDASYGDVAMAVLRDGPDGEDLASLFSLVTVDDQAIRSDELIGICKELFSAHAEDSQALMPVCTFVQSASRFADYSALTENLDAIASNSALSSSARRSAAAAINELRGLESTLSDVYAEYGLQDD